MLCLLLFSFAPIAVTYSHLVVLERLDDQLPSIARVDKPFSWSFSPKTFGLSSGEIKYSALSLPGWLSFDPVTLAFHGTPSAKDEGNPKITVKAEDSSSSLSENFTLCVTPYPQPILQKPIPDQFVSSNPSLSSVFVLSPNSALATHNPALRIPPKWSFSIGFEGDTFTSENDLFYEARLQDGSLLPEWMVFNSKAITLNGVVPNGDTMGESTVISLSLHGSDQEGYTALNLPFDLVIASHELSVSVDCLPTINVTADTSFNVSLISPADFSGFLVDGRAIQISEIKDLEIDTSEFNWLKYDQTTRTLSGKPEANPPQPGKDPFLPATITASFNQSVQTKVALAIVPSYFSTSNLPPIQAVQGDNIEFSLVQDYSNATKSDDVKLTAAFEPAECDTWFKFDSSKGWLAGTVPPNFASTHIVVTFTAYSRVTHSTSHASLPISLRTLDQRKSNAGTHPSGLSAATHAKLVLGLGIAFGVVGGFCLIGGVLAAFRRCARVEDTAIGGEEGRNVWSEQDKRWYGLGLDKVRLGSKLRSPQWTERSPRFSSGEKSNYDRDQTRNTHDYGNLGLGLRRVSERSQSNASSPKSKNQSPGVMSKREFITRIKETVRRVSDKAQNRKPSRQRPIIGKPILNIPHLRDAHSTDKEESPIYPSPSNPFDIPGLQSHPGSTIMTNSPSTSTAEHSIPRRRADFAPPRSPAQVHFKEARLSRQFSSSSTGSLVSNTSVNTHAAEAIVQTATKAISIHSGRNSSGIPRQYSIPELPEPLQVAGARPRLVPFTSASRVPVVRTPSTHSIGSRDNNHSTSKRITSQTAKVWGADAEGDESPVGVTRRGSDELALHYMQSLSANQLIHAPPPEPQVPPNSVVRRVVVGEKFKFRVPIPPATAVSSRTRKIEVKLTSGRPLPPFLRADLSGVKAKGSVEFSGIPVPRDLGKAVLGVYTNGGECLVQVVVEVVGRK
ncbi:hypothetical protein BDZ94DRAFT_1260070 [Collybia nuda]|uniref:Dystroglycan-type cadherin-like domain-containing protein n=1 Tax=Collybia nuda TaxID=64659 RepID=A0A9P5Y819_9AGAR|nr:hypothetical protein BDZ94DRAFT_1260070 [Collybia nuda]